MATTSKPSSTTASRPRATAADRLYGLGMSAAILLLFFGIYSAFFGWRTGAYIAIGAALWIPVLNVGYAIVGYRRTMSRPWPKVPPIKDDDW